VLRLANPSLLFSLVGGFNAVVDYVLVLDFIVLPGVNFDLFSPNVDRFVVVVGRAVATVVLLALNEVLELVAVTPVPDTRYLVGSAFYLSGCRAPFVAV